MATASINMSLYRVLRSLDVPEEAAAGAAEAPAATPVDLSHLATRDDLARFATRDELRAEIAGVHAKLGTEIASVRTEIAGVRTEMAQLALRQTFWLIGAIFTSAGLVVTVLRVFPAK